MQKHVIKYTLAKLIPAVGAILLLMVFTRTFTPSELGIFSAISSVATIIQVTVFQWMGPLALRYQQSGKLEFEQFVQVIAVYFVRCVAILLVSSALFSYLSPYHLSKMIIPTILLSVSLSLYEINLRLLNIQNYSGFYSFISNIKVVFLLVFTYTASLVLPGHTALWVGASLAYFVATLIKPRLNPFSAFKSPQFQIDAPGSSFGIPMAIALTGLVIQDTAGRIILASIRGPAEAGIYATSYDLTTQTIGLVSAIGYLISTPQVFAAQSEARRKKALYWSISFLIMVTLPAFIGFCKVSESMSSLILTEQFRLKGSYVGVLIAASAFLACIKSHYLDYSILISGKIKLLSYISISAASINIILNLFLVPIYGYNGSAFASAISFLFSVSCGIYATNITHCLPFPKKLLLASLTACLVMWFALDYVEFKADLMQIIGSTAIGVAVYVLVMMALLPRLRRKFWLFKKISKC